MRDAARCQHGYGAEGCTYPDCPNAAREIPLAAYPQDDPLIVALLEAHAILAGMQSKGITASPGPREKAMAKIELATRIRKAEL